MSDYKTKCLSILEGVDWEKQRKEFPLIQCVIPSATKSNRFCITDANDDNWVIDSESEMSSADWLHLYAMLSHRIQVPDESGLLPCPHCGGRAEYWTKDHFFHFVNCRKCPAETSCQSRKEDAIKAWNRRATKGGAEQ